MGTRLEIKQSYHRFSRVQKITAGFFLLSTVISIITYFWLRYLPLSLFIFAMALIPSSLIFRATKNNFPFIFTKLSLEKFHLMGEANFYIVKKTFYSKSLFDRKFYSRHLLIIREYRQDGSLFMETPYLKGKISGEVKTWSVDGKLRKSATYQEDDINGKKIEMEGSTVAKEKSYKGALLHGVTKIYDKETGNLISEENFKYGVHHGPSVYYDGKTGVKIKEIQYKNGKKYGTAKFFDLKENLIKTIEYKAGMKYGQSITYYPSGNQKSVTEYIKDQKEGKYLEFYEDGTLKIEYRYREDKKHGPSQAYYKTGKIMTQNFYEMGEQKGKPFFYDPDGNPVTG